MMRGIDRKHVFAFLAQWLPLLAVLGLALALRLIFVTGMVFYDDLEYARSAYNLTQGVLRLGPWAGLPRLGLYAPVALLYVLFGISDATTLAWPLFCSLLTVIVVYAIGRSLAGEAAGLLSALFWALFPLDIQMATALLPDAPLATFTTGAVLFFLIGERSRSRRAMLAYIASLACLAVAMLIKPLAILLLVFFAAYLAWKRPSRKTWIFVVVAVLVTGTLFLYYRFAVSTDLSSNMPGENVVQSQTSTLIALSTTATDWFQVLTQKPEFFAFVPLFMVALVVSLATRQRQASIPLLWAGSVFLYFELGSMTPFHYVPIPANLMSRQILLVMVPFVVLSGVYLGQALNIRVTRYLVMVVTVAMMAIAWQIGTQAPFLPGSSREAVVFRPFGVISTLSTALAIFGSVASPIYVIGTPNRWKTLLMIMLVTGLSLATLNPTYELVSQERRLVLENVRRVVSFVKEQTPSYPLVAMSASPGDLASQIDYLSGFQFGFDMLAPGTPEPQHRIRVVPNDLGKIGNAYVIIQGKMSDRSVPQSWWEIANFGSIEPYQVRVFRTLTTDDANAELESARQSVNIVPDQSNLHRLFGAGINAGDSCAISAAWQGLESLYPESLDGFDPSSALSKCFLLRPDIVGDNLVSNGDFSRNLDGWHHEPTWSSVDVVTDTVDQNPILHASFDGTGDWRAILQGIELQPDTAYIFAATLKSTAPVTG